MLCHAEHASMNHLEQVSKLFLLMLMQFLSYCFNQAWPIRDETIINLARQMLQVLAHEITKLREDSEIMLKSTYGDMMGLLESVGALFFTITFIMLPKPIGLADSSESPDTSIKPWEMTNYPLLIMFVLLGLVYIGVGSNSSLVEEFVNAAHERGSAWAQLLNQRMLIATLQNEVGQCVGWGPGMWMARGTAGRHCR